MTETLRGKPRFDSKTELPQAPEGMELYKFHGQPVLIPVKLACESLVGRTGYTERQLDAIRDLAEVRRKQDLSLARFNYARMRRLGGV